VHLLVVCISATQEGSADPFDMPSDAHLHSHIAHRWLLFRRLQDIANMLAGPFFTYSPLALSVGTPSTGARFGVGAG
jgi:hypothetical protein